MRDFLKYLDTKGRPFTFLDKNNSKVIKAKLTAGAQEDPHITNYKILELKKVYQHKKNNHQ